jgi:hypothetical protein
MATPACGHCWAGSSRACRRRWKSLRSSIRPPSAAGRSREARSIAPGHIAAAHVCGSSTSTRHHPRTYERRRGILVRPTQGRLRQHWREVMGTFLKIGALSYGGAASVGLMQTEVLERRAWLPREQFLEGLALVNTLPGPSGVQLGICLGFTRAGWWGGVLAGLCCILPAFCILLALTLIYHHYSALPRMRHLFYGLSASDVWPGCTRHCKASAPR